MSAALEVRDLTVGFGGLVAVDGVSLDVAGGCVVGLIGPNGAGKTTTIDAICGFVAHRRGTVALAGRRIDHEPPHRRARAGLVRTFQSIELFDDLTVAENVRVAAVRPRWRSTVLDAVAPRRRRDDTAVGDALDRVGLAGRHDARPVELSHGERRLVSLARALAAHPQVVLLDEPAAGLDPDETAALGRVVRAVASGCAAVLLVDHDMALVLDVCDELVALDLGAVIASGATSAVRADERVVDAYLGHRS